MLASDLPGLVNGVPTSMDGRPAVISGQPGYDFHETVEALHSPFADRPTDVTFHVCESVANYNNGVKCICLDLSETFDELYPKDLWHDDTKFSQLARTQLYGKPVRPIPRIHDKDVIPKIGHYNYFGGGTMDFLFYLSVLSCFHILKLEKVYIHGNLPLNGPYWEILQSDNYAERFMWIRLERSNTIFGKELETVAHAADVSATNVIIKHGGVHCDPDAIFVREFDPSFWRHEAVFGLGWRRKPLETEFPWEPQTPSFGD